jgi:hypothetical protein
MMRVETDAGTALVMAASAVMPTDAKRVAVPRLRQSHIFAPDPHGHYVEPHWCGRRLLDAESFDPVILDPCCGWGRILEAALAAGHRALGSDIIDRGAAARVPGVEFRVADFLRDSPIAQPPFSIVGNPPFDQLQEFVERALTLRVCKFAFIWRLERLAAARWLRATPLARVYLLNPRPSMPPGHHIESGGYVGGDSHDYCWLTFEHGYTGRPEMLWLVRGKANMAGSEP